MTQASTLGFAPSRGPGREGNSSRKKKRKKTSGGRTTEVRKVVTIINDLTLYCGKEGERTPAGGVGSASQSQTAAGSSASRINFFRKGTKTSEKEVL